MDPHGKFGKFTKFSIGIHCVSQASQVVSQAVEGRQRGDARRPLSAVV